MSRSTIDSVLRQFGQEKDVKGLQDYMETVDISEVCHVYNKI